MEVQKKAARLFFIDAMRAWAILMMLQGHFVDGLLDTVFRDPDSIAYSTWRYFRGITAPVFFTVSGFIFTYLLVRVPEQGLNNPRVKKGIRRGLQLLLIGYLLRLNLLGLFKGEIYYGFYVVDVLHCIGMSILAIIGVYTLTANRKKYVFPLLLIGITLLLFLFEPIYKQWTFDLLPVALANYFTKVNGSVFTIIPWLGYATLGGGLALLFTRFKNFKYLYPTAITMSAMIGFGLIFGSSPAFMAFYETTGIGLFQLIQQNNYLFIRLGDVFVVFAVFMLFRRLMTDKTVLRIGANTLSIYVIHFVILYGSFTGLGLYKFFHHELTPAVAISGALVFMVVCTYLALLYDRHETSIKGQLNGVLLNAKEQLVSGYHILSPVFRELLLKLKMTISKIFGTVRN